MPGELTDNIDNPKKKNSAEMGTPKEATIIIIDVGKPMGGCNHGRPISDLDWAMQYVWDKIISTVCSFKCLVLEKLFTFGLGSYWT